MKIPAATITEELREAIYDEIINRPYQRETKNYLIDLPLFEEEVAELIAWLKRNPEATEEQAKEMCNQITDKWTDIKKMTGMQRDCMYSPIAFDFIKRIEERRRKRNSQALSQVK